MRGICIDAGATTVLIEGQKYFLFENGQNNFYVSKFDNPGAHCGSYQRKYFKLVDEPAVSSNLVANEEQPERIKLQRFVAQVKKYRSGYNIGDLFIITEKGENGFYHVYLKDQPAKNPVGSYVANFFEIITPYDEIETVQAIKAQETAQIKPVEKTVIKPLPKEATAEFEPNLKPSKAIQQTKPDQLTIFDFLEG